MKLAHVALWCRDLDRATAFWVEHFGAQAGERYASTRRPGFVSRFVTFDEGATLELMSIPGLEAHAAQAADRPGWAHVVIRWVPKRQSMRWRSAWRVWDCWPLHRAGRVTAFTKR